MVVTVCVWRGLFLLGISQLKGVVAIRLLVLLARRSRSLFVGVLQPKWGSFLLSFRCYLPKGVGLVMVETPAKWGSA